LAHYVRGLARVEEQLESGRSVVGRGPIVAGLYTEQLVAPAYEVEKMWEGSTEGCWWWMPSPLMHAGQY